MDTKLAGPCCNPAWGYVICSTHFNLLDTAACVTNEWHTWVTSDNKASSQPKIARCFFEVYRSDVLASSLLGKN